jgi:hypothetical protein
VYVCYFYRQFLILLAYIGAGYLSSGLANYILYLSLRKQENSRKKMVVGDNRAVLGFG